MTIIIVTVAFFFILVTAAELREIRTEKRITTVEVMQLAVMGIMGNASWSVENTASDTLKLNVYVRYCICNYKVGLR